MTEENELFEKVDSMIFIRLAIRKARNHYHMTRSEWMSDT